MSLLAKATGGKQVKPQINVFMGIPKIGKTTLAAKFEKPFFLDLENRSFHVDVQRLTGNEVTSLEQIQSLIEELTVKPHDYKSFTIDSAESLEDVIHSDICKRGGVESIEQYDGGYGKGYVRAQEIMRDLMMKLQTMRDKRGMTVNIVAHTATRNFSDPATNAQFTRYEMRVNGKLGAVVRDLADNLFFITHKYSTFTDKATKKTKALGDGDRVVYTEWRPAFDAGNTLGLPFEIDLDDFMESYMKAGDALKPKSEAELREEIQGMIKHLDDETRTKAVSRLTDAKTTAELQTLKDKIVLLLKPTGGK